MLVCDYFFYLLGQSDGREMVFEDRILFLVGVVNFAHVSLLFDEEFVLEEGSLDVLYIHEGWHVRVGVGAPCFRLSCGLALRD